MRLLTLALAAILATGIGLRPVWSAFYPSCNKPLKGWLQPKDKIPHHAVAVTIALGWNKALWWNNGAVNWSEFQKLLNASAKSTERAFWILKPNPVADCKDVNWVRYEMERALACSKGWCGEGDGIWEWNSR